VTECRRSRRAVRRALAVAILAGVLLLGPGRAADEGVVLQTWEDVLSWVEARGWRVVSLPSLRGDLRSPVEVGPDTPVDPVLVRLSVDEWVHYGLIDDRLAVLRPHLKYRCGAPQHLTLLQELSAAAVELLRNLPDDDWRRLAVSPIAAAQLPPRSLVAYRQFRRLAMFPVKAEPDAALCVVAYSPWVLIDDGTVRRLLPLRTDANGWLPALRRAEGGWVYTDGPSGDVARPEVGGALAPWLEDETRLDITSADTTLHDLLRQLAPDARVDPDEGERSIRLTPASYPRGRLLSAALEATACVLKEIGEANPMCLVSASPGLPPPEEPALARARLGAATAPILQALALASRETLAAAMQVKPESLTCGTRRCADLEPTMAAHLAELVRIYAMYGSDEAAMMPVLSPDTSITLTDGTLFGFAEYSDAGEWECGYSIVIGDRDHARDQ